MDCDCVLLSVLVLLLVRLPTGFGFGYGFNISMLNTKYPRDGLPKCGSLVKKCAAQELTHRRDKRQGTREMSGSGQHIKHSQDLPPAPSPPLPLLVTYVSLFMCVYLVCFFLRMREGWRGRESKGSAVSFVILNFSESLVSCRLNFHRRKTKHPFGGFMQMPRILRRFCSQQCTQALGLSVGALKHTPLLLSLLANPLMSQHESQTRFQFHFQFEEREDNKQFCFFAAYHRMT